MGLESSNLQETHHWNSRDCHIWCFAMWVCPKISSPENPLANQNLRHQNGQKIMELKDTIFRYQTQVSYQVVYWYTIIHHPNMMSLFPFTVPCILVKEPISITPPCKHCAVQLELWGNEKPDAARSCPNNGVPKCSMDGKWSNLHEWSGMLNWKLFWKNDPHLGKPLFSTQT